MAVEKIYEDDDYVIVNKPFDMFINSNNENEKNTVACHIASHDSHLSTSSNPLHFAQRLDYSTSGVLCIAKTKQAAARAGRLFEKRLTRKYYVAVLRRHLQFDVADIKYAIGEDLAAEGVHRMVAVTGGGGGGARAAHTRLLALEAGAYGGQPATVVLLKPITGRPHQLRVHCMSVGHTILGDYTYSDRKDTAPHRMFLHATRLVLPFQSSTLDIQTQEPFFTDERFASKWKSDRVLFKYRSKEDFASVCDVIDENLADGLRYEEFCCRE
ncbi:RNA pseudouridylate synthase domain-containing protein 1-like [Nymphalis io]|uniref:RNA pseudouridylate synthase domain-containing protein 1-like n=1 Tax=Inachis io TaxID=171585 RepID=UPI0021676361|nr:RNA pseudouridylate synthase domain-containing protein 1-like [Nymphalis io]